MSDFEEVQFSDAPATGIADLATTDGFWTAAHQEAPYTFYDISVECLRDEGVVQVPVAEEPKPYGSGDGVECEVCQVSAPYGLRVVRWEARRQGKKCVIPDPKPSDPAKLVLKSSRVRNYKPAGEADGATREYRARGVYVYFELAPSDTATGYPGPAAPYDSQGAIETTLQAGDFDANLLGGDARKNIKKLI